MEHLTNIVCLAAMGLCQPIALPAKVPMHGAKFIVPAKRRRRWTIDMGASVEINSREQQ